METDRSEIAGIFPSNFVEPIGDAGANGSAADLSFAPSQTDASASASSSVDVAFDTTAQESDSALNVPSFRH